MSDISIDPTDVRNRLRTISEVAITDEVLSSLPFIGVADSWMTVLLTNSGTTEGALSEDEGVLVKGAKIAYVCKKVVSSAPENSYQEGPVEFKAISSTDKEKLLKMLDDEISEYLDMCELVTADWTDLVTSAGGDDYHPNFEDRTNIDFGYADDDSDHPHRIFP